MSASKVACTGSAVSGVHTTASIGPTRCSMCADTRCHVESSRGSARKANSTLVGSAAATCSSTAITAVSSHTVASSAPPRKRAHPVAASVPASTTTKPASGSNVTVQSVPEEHTVLVYMLAGGSPMCADLRNVPHALLRHATDDPGGIAFRTLDGETWTWRDYLERAARFAGGLRRLGVAPGDRVVLMLRNRLEFHVADVGALLAGATPISIYNSSSPDQISYLAGHCGAVLAVTEEGEFADRMLAGALEVPGIRSVVVVGDVPSGATAYDDVA